MKFECDCKDADEMAKPLGTELADGYRSAHQGKAFSGLLMNVFPGVSSERRHESLRDFLKGRRAPPMRASMCGISDSPVCVREYSTRGGTSG